jgi:hypothetical protein
VQHELYSISRAGERLIGELGDLKPERIDSLLSTNFLAMLIPWEPGGPSSKSIAFVRGIVKNIDTLGALAKSIHTIRTIGAPNSSGQQRRSNELRGVDNHAKQTGDQVRVDAPELLVTLQFLDKSHASKVKWILVALLDREIGPRPQRGQSERLFAAHASRITEWDVIREVVLKWVSAGV